MTDLIVQGLLMMIEDDVTVRVRSVDAKVAEACLGAGAAKYSQIIKEQTGMNKNVKLSVDRPGCRSWSTAKVGEPEARLPRWGLPRGDGGAVEAGQHPGRPAAAADGQRQAGDPEHPVPREVRAKT